MEPRPRRVPGPTGGVSAVPELGGEQPGPLPTLGAATGGSGLGSRGESPMGFAAVGTSLMLVECPRCSWSVLGAVGASSTLLERGLESEACSKGVILELSRSCTMPSALLRTFLGGDAQLCGCTVSRASQLFGEEANLSGVVLVQFPSSGKCSPLPDGPGVLVNPAGVREALGWPRGELRMGSSTQSSRFCPGKLLGAR